MEKKPNEEDLNPLNPLLNSKEPLEEENLPARSSKKSNVPVAKLKTARLGLDVANNWDNFFPSLSSNLVNARDLRTDAQTLKDIMEEVDRLDTVQKKNTSDLKLLNVLLNRKVTELKIHIKSEYVLEADPRPIFKAYGLISDSRGTYLLPTDNHGRDLSLQILVAKMQEPNNPLANKPFGLAEWANLSQKHSQLWTSSRQIATRRSDLLSNSKNPYDKVQNGLRNVKKMIRANFPANEQNGKMRAFGFLRESV